MRRVLERQVQAAWYDAGIRPRNLFTSRGSDVVVVSPGEWNHEAGPDFLGAVLEVGAAHRRIVGDVEIHLCPTDWDLHGHGSDPNYRNVVAHVTWREGKLPSSLPDNVISIFLGHYLPSEKLPSCERLLAYPYARLPISVRPCRQALARNPELAVKALATAGRHRLRMKARRMLGLISERPLHSRQIFYEEVMCALGYSGNSSLFRSIAARVPLDILMSAPAEAESALVTASSFEPVNRHCGRPNNDPMRRIASAARLFAESEVMSLSAQSDFSPGACRASIRLLCGDHYMGKGRAGAVLANVVVPFAVACGRISSLPKWLPPEDISAPVRLAASRILGVGKDVEAIYSGNDLLIQGLIQIHRDFCLKTHPDCEDCGFKL